MSTRTSKGALQTGVADMNPWWRGSGWEATDPDLVPVRGSGLGYESPALRDPHPGGLYVLRGPRRVGKTVATKQLIASLLQRGAPGGSIVRIAVDGWPVRDLQTVARNLALPMLPSDVRRFWVIDEATGIDGDWPSAIKWMRDNVPEFHEATVVVTGSDAEQLTSAIGSWAGRRGDAPDRDRTLLPIGFRTFVDLLWPDAPRMVPRLPLADLRTPVATDAYRSLIPWSAELARMWRRYLTYGGYPRAVAAARLGQAIPPGFVDDIFDVIFRDAFAHSRLSRTDASTLVERVMTGMGSPLNSSNVAADIDAAHSTVVRHLEYLRNAYLTWTCPQKTARGWTPLAKAQDKVYAIDPVVARIAYLRNTAREDIDPTILTEMLLGLAIRRALIADGYDGDGDESLFHVRTPARKEIDFVSHRLRRAAIEAKFTDGSWRRAAVTVRASEWHGILATESVLDLGDTEGPWAVPAGVLAYLIDT
ncbi:MAG: ATP-binding protein [Chloroflexi bacterium]|nr:ATP-binding protein [Chloroflexota bacterium]